MNASTSIPRKLRICVLNQEPRVIDKQLAAIEREIAQIQDFDLVKIKSVDDDNLHPCDLLIVIVHQLDQRELFTWVKGLAKRMESAGNIKIPALLIGDFTSVSFSQLMTFAVEQNWYFDLIDLNHLTSLGIRSANLLRIHDHIHELSRYEKTMKKLELQVEELQVKLNEF